MQCVELTVPAEDGEIDSLCERLEQLGVEGMCIEDEADFRRFLENNRQYWDYVDEALDKRFTGLSRVKFYLPEDDQGKARLAVIQAALGRELQLGTVDDADWENGWKAYYEPLPIGEHLLVVPEWLNPDPGGRIVLRLDPGIAFGSGSHATTRMCLEALEHWAAPGKTALDLGCGSGILGIAALLLDCAQVRGCDIDPKAPDAARRNAALNGIDEPRYQVCAGDLLADESLRRSLGDNYNIVLANIVADVIEPLSAFVRRFMAEDAVLICSGIINERAAGLERTLRRNGFTVLEHRQQEEWHCFVCNCAHPGTNQDSSISTSSKVSPS